MDIILSLTYVSIDSNGSHSKYYFHDHQTKVASTVHLLPRIASNNYDFMTILLCTFSHKEKCLLVDRSIEEIFTMLCYSLITRLISEVSFNFVRAHGVSYSLYKCIQLNLIANYHPCAAESKDALSCTFK